MNDYYENIKNFINQNDLFCKFNNIQLIEVQEGHAVAILNNIGHSENALGIIQGSAIFALADIAFAGASNSYENTQCVSMSSNITFFRPGKGQQLKAIANVLNKGSRSCFVEIEIFDENQKLIAKVTTTGFFIQS